MTITLVGDFTVQAGETYASNDWATFFFDQPYREFSFRNFGTITATGDDATGLHSWNSFGTIHNAGLIRAEGGSLESGHLVARGIYGASWCADIINTGRIEVVGHFASGVTSFQSDQILENSGVISVVGWGDARGVTLYNGGNFHNTGRLEVSGGNAVGVLLDHFEEDFFENWGEIIVTSSNEWPSYGLKVSGIDEYYGPPTAPNIVNHGLLQADIAIYAGIGGIVNRAVPVQIVANYGTLVGEVHLFDGEDQFLNHGILEGDVFMGNGVDFVDLSEGRNTGLIDLGMDDDLAIGSAFSDDIFGSSNNDVIHGGLGNDRLDGGSDSDQLFGGEGDDYLVGSFGRDLVEGGDGDDVIQGDWTYAVEGWNGEDLLSGGAGDDRITGGEDNDRIDGGAGHDIAIFRGLRSGYMISTVDGVTTLLGRDGVDTLVGVETLQFTDGVFDLQGRLIERLADERPSADTIAGTPEDDIISAGGGDDVITPGSGYDVIDGGAGHDIVNLSGLRSQYSILRVGDDFLFKGASGSLHVTNVERVQFSDGGVLDLARLYEPDRGRSVSGDADPEVLPAAVDDDFLAGKDAGAPLVLPGAVDDGLPDRPVAADQVLQWWSQMDGRINPLLVSAPDGLYIQVDRPGDHETLPGFDPWQ